MMEFLLFAFATFGAIMFWKRIVKPMLPNRQNVERGLVAVRAAYFICMVQDGSHTPDEANQIVAAYDTDMPQEIIREAISFINMAYEGKQLPMIQHARELGYAG